MIHVNLYAQGTWESVESPTDQFLTSVYFVDSLYGWAVGYSGTIIHTTNGGTDWSFQTRFYSHVVNLPANRGN